MSPPVSDASVPTGPPLGLPSTSSAGPEVKAFGRPSQAGGRRLLRLLVTLSTSPLEGDTTRQASRPARFCVGTLAHTARQQGTHTDLSTLALVLPGGRLPQPQAVGQTSRRSPTPSLEGRAERSGADAGARGPAPRPHLPPGSARLEPRHAPRSSSGPAPRPPNASSLLPSPRPASLARLWSPPRSLSAEPRGRAGTGTGTARWSREVARRRPRAVGRGCWW